MSPDNCSNIGIQSILDARFTNKELLEQALTRRDYVEKLKPRNEISKLKYQNGLDTLGDSILDFCIINHFYDQHIPDPEYYNQQREKYGNNKILHEFSNTCIKLWSVVHWSPDEEAKKKWETESKEMLALCFEAIIGALFLDGGFNAVESFLSDIDFFNQIDIFTAKK